MRRIQMAGTVMMLALLAWISVIPAAGAITLTPEQMKVAAGLSGQQKADLIHFKGSEFDLRLRDGDKLTIPQQPDQVLVLGLVYNQAALLYRRDFSPDEYVDMAGGTKRFADTGRIYVIRANGEVDVHHSAWRSKRTYPGDTIVVPQNMEQFHLLDSVLDWSRAASNIGVRRASFRAVGIL